MDNISTNTDNNIFDPTPLTIQAKILLQENPSADQVIIMMTTKGNIYSLINESIINGNNASEDAIISIMDVQKDIEISHIICMWQGNSLDVPSMYLRKKIITLHSQNAKAKVLLQGKNDYLVKELESTIPKTNSDITNS